ncbi:MAG: 30S ribosomal protein S6 [Cyclonatronaceae bacterium]
MKTNYYEVTFVINPVLEEEQVKEVKDGFESFIAKKGAEIDEVDEWGIKRLAYEIDGKNSGYFVNAYFQAPGTIVSELERYFKLQENILRNIILKYDNKMLKHRELQKKGKLPAIFSETPEEE